MLGKRRERGNGKIKPYLVHIQLLNPGVFLEKEKSICQLEFSSLTEYSSQCLGYILHYDFPDCIN